MVAKTGEYIITFYTKIGSKIKTLSGTAESLTDAISLGEDNLILDDAFNNGHNPETFSVDRRVYNSADPHKKW